MYNVLLPNLFRPNVNFIAGEKVGISSNRLHTRRHFQEKPSDHTHGIIYRRYLSRATINVSFQLTPLRSCACAGVSNFKYRDVKTFLLKLGSELQNRVKKFQSSMKIQTKYRLNFYEVKNFHELEWTPPGNIPKELNFLMFSGSREQVGNKWVKNAKFAITIYFVFTFFSKINNQKTAKIPCQNKHSFYLSEHHWMAGSKND